MKLGEPALQIRRPKSSPGLGRRLPGGAESRWGAPSLSPRPRRPRETDVSITAAALPAAPRGTGPTRDAPPAPFPAGGGGGSRAGPRCFPQPGESQTSLPLPEPGTAPQGTGRAPLRRPRSARSPARGAAARPAAAPRLLALQSYGGSVCVCVYAFRFVVCWFFLFFFFSPSFFSPGEGAAAGGMLRPRRVQAP